MIYWILKLRFYCIRLLTAYLAVFAEPFSDVFNRPDLFGQNTSDKIEIGKSSILALNKKIRILIDGNLFNEAIESQKEKILITNEIYGKNSWQSKSENSFLHEIDVVSKLKSIQRIQYIKIIKDIEIASLKMKNGNLGQSQSVLEDALPKLKNLLIKNSTYIAIATEKIGINYLFMGEGKKAEKHLEESLRCYTEILGNLNPIVNNVMINLAESCILNRDYDKAEYWLKIAINNVEKTEDKNTINNAYVYALIANALIKKQKHEEAYAFNTKAMSIAKTLINPNDKKSIEKSIVCHLGFCLFNSANIKKSKNEINSAKTDYKNSLALFENAPIHWSITKIEVLKEYLDLLKINGEIEEAKKIKEKIADIEISLLQAKIR